MCQAVVDRNPETRGYDITARQERRPDVALPRGERHHRIGRSVCAASGLARNFNCSIGSIGSEGGGALAAGAGASVFSVAHVPDHPAARRADLEVARSHGGAKVLWKRPVGAHTVGMEKGVELGFGERLGRRCEPNRQVDLHVLDRIAGQIGIELRLDALELHPKVLEPPRLCMHPTVIEDLMPRGRELEGVRRIVQLRLQPFLLVHCIREERRQEMDAHRLVHVPAMHAT